MFVMPLRLQHCASDADALARRFRARAPTYCTERGLQAELDLELARLQDRLDRGQVTGRVGAVHQAVVVGEGQVRHVTGADDRALLGLDDRRTLDRGADTEDRDLARR